MTNSPGWHGVGRAIGPDHPPDKALAALGIDWRVLPIPVPNELRGTVTDYCLLVRSDTEDEVGMVRSSYEPQQNADAFGWMRGPGVFPAVGGEMFGGKRVFLASAVGEPLDVPGETSRLQTYIVCSTCHDGKGSLTVFPVVVREAGGYILRLAGDHFLYRARHTGAQAAVTPEQAKKLLRQARAYGKLVAATASKLLAVPWGPDDFEAVIDVIRPENAKATASGQAHVHARIANTRGEIRTAWASMAPIEGIRETAWGALMAVADYNDWGRQTQGLVKHEGKATEAELKQHRAKAVELRLQRILFEKQDYVPAALAHLDPSFADRLAA